MQPNSPKYLSGKLSRDFLILEGSSLISPIPVKVLKIDLISLLKELCLAFLRAVKQLLAEQNLKGPFVKRKNIMAAHHQDCDAASSDEIEPDSADKHTQQPEIHLIIWQGDPYDDWDIKQ